MVATLNRWFCSNQLLRSSNKNSIIGNMPKSPRVGVIHLFKPPFQACLLINFLFFMPLMMWLIVWRNWFLTFFGMVHVMKMVCKTLIGLLLSALGFLVVLALAIFVIKIFPFWQSGSGGFYMSRMLCGVGSLCPVFLKAQGALRRIGPLEPRRKAQKKARAFFHKAHYI